MSRAAGHVGLHGGDDRARRADQAVALCAKLTRGYWDITAEERLTIYRRYVTLALEHWGDDDHGRGRLREFLRWHLGFWCRYAPQTRQTARGRRCSSARARGRIDRRWKRCWRDRTMRPSST